MQQVQDLNEHKLNNQIKEFIGFKIRYNSWDFRAGILKFRVLGGTSLIRIQGTHKEFLNIMQL